MREELSRAKAILVRACPFVASLLMRARIVRVSELPLRWEESPAGVDSDGTVFIAEKAWSRLDFRERVSLLSHLALHLALLHHRRMRGKEEEAWNLAADAVVNERILELGLPLPPKSVMGGRLGVKGWEKMSTEELYEELRKKIMMITVPLPGWSRQEEGVDLSLPFPDLLPTRGLSERGEGEMGQEGLSERGEGEMGQEGLPGGLEGLPGGLEGEVIQEGDPNLYDPSAGGEELERRWKEATFAALMAQKTAGKLPVGFERLFDEVLKPKVNLRGLFRQAIRSGLGRTVVSDWTRPSRKNPDLPGVKRMTIPSIFALVDTSGSIDEKELSLFVGTVLEFAGQTKVQVICWDAEAYEPVKLPNRSVEPLKGKMKGGGGTVIRPALEKTLKQMKPLDMVAILSDFEIFDWNKPKVKELLSKIAAKASVAVLLSTHKEVSAPRWRSLRLH